MNQKLREPMNFRYLIVFMICSLAAGLAGAQSPVSCDCSKFPVDKSCVVQCLGTATAAQLQTGFKLPAPAASRIAGVRNRKSFKHVQDFKPYLSGSDYQTLSSVIDENTIVQNNNSGTNIGHDQINNYYNTPGKDSTGSRPALNPPASGMSQVVNGVSIRVDRCTLQNYTLTVNFTLTNISTQPQLQITFRQADMTVIDDQGNLFHSSSITIGNMTAQKYAFSRLELIKNIQVRGVATFQAASDIQRIARLEISQGSYFFDVPVSK
jgi:hypothetical protein